MKLSKSKRNNDVEISTHLGSQYSFPIKGARLLGEITDCRAQRRNIEEESRGSYCIKNEVLKKIPWNNGVMSKKTGMSFQMAKTRTG